QVPHMPEEGTMMAGGQSHFKADALALSNRVRANRLKHHMDPVNQFRVLRPGFVSTADKDTENGKDFSFLHFFAVSSPVIMASHYRAAALGESLDKLQALATTSQNAIPHHP
ncbi:50S ribosomal protein L3, partial [Dissostichus eleginoides]